MPFPGPDWLGRGLVLPPGAPAPADWSDVTRVRSVPESLDALQHAWLGRKRIIVELTMPAAQLKAKETCDVAPYELDPSFELTLERLCFLVWANNYDGTRPGEAPIWWHERLARRLGAEPCDEAEVRLEGRAVWCDGGPRGGLSEPVLHRESIESGALRLTHPFTGTIADLADDQRAAVLHPSGAARIIAPAGSGKTRVLTQRLRHLLDQRGYEPSRVTALAYNRRAAEEMSQRAGKGNIKTLHALGYKLVLSDRQVNLIDEREVRDILRSLVRLPPVLGQDPLAPFLEALAEVRLALRTPEEVEKRRPSDLPGFAKVFERYRDILFERSLIDHDEQIYGALEVLLRRPELRRQAQLACTHLLVDEFQDLTPAYLLMVRLLAAPSYQVFGVGDDDQVIYGYAGATPRYLVDFRRYFPGASEYALETNYRCPTGIVEAASHLLQRNKVRVAKTIRSGPSNPAGEPQVTRTAAGDWAPTAVRLLQAWLQETSPRNVAVLSRVKATLMPLQIYLAAAGVPHSSIVDGTVLGRTGIRTALSYLRLAGGGRFAAADLAEALRRPSRKLKREVMAEASAQSGMAGLLSYAATLDGWAASQLQGFAGDLKMLAGQLSRGTEAVLTALRTRVGLGDAMAELDQSSADAAASHLDDLIALEQLARLHPNAATFEPWLRESLKSSAPEGPAVRLSTVHRVKGMEWDRVLVYGAQQGLFPHRLADDVEEERRTFHVALTRARKVAVVLADSGAPSVFLEELKPLPPPKAPKQKKKKKKGVLSREADPARVGAFAASIGVSALDLTGALQRLGDNERWVFQWRYGLADGQCHELDDIARTLGKTPSAVTTWQQLAERSLRGSLGRKLDFKTLG